MCTRWSDIIANNFTPPESLLDSNIPGSPSFPSPFQVRISQLPGDGVFYALTYEIFLKHEEENYPFSFLVNTCCIKMEGPKYSEKRISGGPEARFDTGTIQAFKILFESVSAEFSWSSDNYRLSQETSSSTPDSITKSHASHNITIAVNKVKFILLFLYYSKEKASAWLLPPSIKSSPSLRGTLGWIWIKYFFSKVVVIDALNLNTKPPVFIACFQILAIRASST